MAWRCDAFYRCWYDVTDPAPIRETQAVHDRPTRGGTHSTTPDDAKYYNIFGLDSLPRWGDIPTPLVRRLHAQDAPAIAAHLLGLNAHDRRLRFCRESTDAQIRAYVHAIDWRCSLILGAFCADRLVGIAEALFDRSTAPQDAEIAVSVDFELRGRGLGRHLAGLAVARAGGLGTRHSTFTFMRENRPIQKIVRALGGLIDMEDLMGVVWTADFAPAHGHADALAGA